MHTHGGNVALGLFRLRASGRPGRASGEIYAVFEVIADPEYAGREWDGAIIMNVLPDFEARIKHKPAVGLGRTSPYPRVLSLQELLKALKSLARWYPWVPQDVKALAKEKCTYVDIPVEQQRGGRSVRLQRPGW